MHQMGWGVVVVWGGVVWGGVLEIRRRLSVPAAGPKLSPPNTLGNRNDMSCLVPPFVNSVMEKEATPLHTGSGAVRSIKGGHPPRSGYGALRR